MSRHSCSSSRGRTTSTGTRGSFHFDLIVDIPAAGGPDVWMSFSAAWPVVDSARMRAFFDDLLAELESMADSSDRCRWPLDEPWPHVH